MAAVKNSVVGTTPSSLSFGSMWCNCDALGTSFYVIFGLQWVSDVHQKALNENDFGRLKNWVKQIGSSCTGYGC